MKKKLMALVMGTGLALGLAGCGGGDDDAADNNNDTGEEVVDGGETASAGVEEIYQQSCASCHGGNLEGRNGPELETVGSRIDKAEILDVIDNGRPGMPGGLIKGDDAEKVADWLAEKK